MTQGRKNRHIPIFCGHGLRLSIVESTILQIGYLKDKVEDSKVCKFLWFYGSLNQVTRELLSRGALRSLRMIWCLPGPCQEPGE